MYYLYDYLVWVTKYGEALQDIFSLILNCAIVGFPLVHSSKFIKKDVVNDYSLLYTIQGSNSRAGLLPYLLASHLDVVPADPKTWEVPPFSGNIINKTYIYGRGAIDDKSGVMVSYVQFCGMLKFVSTYHIHHNCVWYKFTI